jgi:D-alanine-D-alanine ligase
MRKKLRVAVLMGGNSSEYEISLISGREVLTNLSKKYVGIPIIIPKKGSEWVDRLLLAKADICFIAMHGPFGEDGKIQGLLDTLGIKYTGSKVAASAIGMDKILFRKMMIAENLPIPAYVVIAKNEKKINLARLKKLPYFVKPYDQGSSVGASIVRRRRDLKKALNLAFRFSDKALVDEYLKGMEVTCSVLGNEDAKALPVIEIIPRKGDFFDYESKYTESGSDEIVPARISKKLTKIVQELSINVHKAIGARGFSRVDFILKNNKDPIILEINTIPGLTPMSLLPKAAKAYGLSYSELLDKIIKYSIYE